MTFIFLSIHVWILQGVCRAPAYGRKTENEDDFITGGKGKQNKIEGGKTRVGGRAMKCFSAGGCVREITLVPVQERGKGYEQPPDE